MRRSAPAPRSFSHTVVQGSPGLPEATLAAITEPGVESVTLVGGEAVVRPGVGEVLDTVGLSVDRIAGDDRYVTSAAVMTRARAEGATGDRAWVATG
jgi:putative cell wall-binding protein